MRKNRVMNSPGLRERKKQKTRWAIRDHALRLFAAQGYDATTVDQIAAAAEISPSTFFRYFKTKEDLIVEDEYDALLLASLEAVPPDLAPMTALRRAISDAFATMDDRDWAKLRERSALIMSHPALRARSMENLLATMNLVAGALARRSGRSPNDFEVRCLAGAVVGAMLQVIEEWLRSGDVASLPEVIDRTFAYLESGLTI